MNSKQALENLVHCKSSTKCKECRHKERCTMERDYNIIKQDLDRLEELKKENKHNEEMVSINRKLWKEEIEKNMKLLKQISWNEVEIDELKKENQKLKKAIEILKDKITIYNQFDNLLGLKNGYEEIILTKEEYDLLKEVLE